MSRFIESIKVEDGNIFLLPFHQIRLNETLARHNSSVRIDVVELYNELKFREEGLFKFRIEYDVFGDIKAEFQPYERREIADFALVEAEGIEYDFKYANRQKIQACKEHANAEEIIFVQNGMICDTSFSNLIFLRNNNWYTPRTFLLNGVQRQYLISERKIQIADISVQNLSDFSAFQLINALNSLGESFVYPLAKIINIPQLG